MRTKPFILLSTLFLLALNVFANERNVELDIIDETEEIFTSKDKDFLQRWHYEEILKMDMTEEGRDEYFSYLNQFTYKMSRLGLAKYQFTDAERKYKFNELADRLDASMKQILSPNNFIIHIESFDKIEHIVYEKRNWEQQEAF